MTKTEVKTASAAVKDILLSNPDGLHEVLRAVMQEVLEAEMDEALGASKSERMRDQAGNELCTINVLRGRSRTANGNKPVRSTAHVCVDTPALIQLDRRRSELLWC